MISFTEAQARALVTDAGTLQRGQQLANAGKWGRLGRNEQAAWGECAGSGSKPYLTGIDLSEPAFKCSCPSRVFPCKHGAGLLLLLAREPDLLTPATPPDWLAEWLEKRQSRQSAPAKAVSTEALEPEPAALADPAKDAASAAARQQREAQRQARMDAGAADLETWLLDLMRAGLASLDQQPRTFWESQAARLVDNQLPGLAATVRELAGLRHAHADWPPRLLARLGELYWLVRAFQNRAQLSEDARQEVQQQVGINLKKEDLLAQAAPVSDEWQVLGQITQEEDRLTARRSWLRGSATGRYALVLEYAFGGQAFATALLPEAYYEGSLVFYPGLLPLRAVPGALTFAGTALPQAAPPGLSPAQLLEGYADALARNPWLREWPATLAEVQPQLLPTGSWVLRQAAGLPALPLRLPDSDAGWQLLARSGGQPLTVFGEWNGQGFRPLASWASFHH
jgi:hypothetical protein